MKFAQAHSLKTFYLLDVAINIKVLKCKLFKSQQN